MAEAVDAEDKEGVLPQKGKVESVCKQWLVHEDGVLAYKLQNEEMDFHYGLNRYNRRTVREDIPVAKLVQSEEEIRQQQERMEQLMLLKTQAEEDEKVAQSVMKDLDSEEAVQRLRKEVSDEDYARKMQEKEKRRFERWKREQQLKKERERLELELARQSEEARLVINKDSRGGTDPAAVEGSHTRQSSGDMENVRVTAGGRIEDDGDFSDFYIPPADHMEEGEKKQLQELQDEELARLLQEQEHKRTKAEVDKGKLKQIEQQDAQLARIIHEQDKLKAKKVRQRKQKSMDEARRQRGQQEAQRSMSVDEHGAGGVDMGSPQSVNSGGTPNSQRSIRDHNGVSGHEDIGGQMSPTSSLSQGRSPVNHEQRSPMYQGRSSREDPPHRYSPVMLPSEDAGEVERWLGRNHSQSPANQRIPPRSHDQHMQRSPSPPSSYHSDEVLHDRPGQTQNNITSQRDQSPVPFNIAMAIDPTYRHVAQDPRSVTRTTESRPPMLQSQSYPMTSGPGALDEDLEEDYDDEEDPGWAPVQGQRRSNMEKSKKVAKKPAGKRSSCKQQ